MRLTYIGKDPASQGGHCPALYSTDRGTYVVQGKIITDPEALGDLRDIGSDETYVEVSPAVLDLYRA